MSTEPMKLVGILNITPDSFSDGGHYFDTKSAIKHALLASDIGNPFPTRRQILIEIGRAVKHAIRASDFGNLPSRQITTEIACVLKHARHVCYLSNIPSRQSYLHGGSI